MEEKFLYNIDEFNNWFCEYLGTYDMIAIYEPSPEFYPVIVKWETNDNGLNDPFCFYSLHYKFDYMNNND